MAPESTAASADAASDIIFPKSGQHIADNNAEERTNRLPAKRIGDTEDEQQGQHESYDQELYHLGRDRRLLRDDKTEDAAKPRCHDERSNNRNPNLIHVPS